MEKSSSFLFPFTSFKKNLSPNFLLSKNDCNINFSWQTATIYFVQYSKLTPSLSSGMDSDEIANSLHREPRFPSYSLPEPQASMSPSAGDVTQTPDSKPSSGLASVFKNLTGNRSSKSPNPQSPASIAPQQLNGNKALQTKVYGGPPNYEELYTQLKAGNPRSERIAAAASLRYAVQDYPLSGVCKIDFMEAF